MNALAIMGYVALAISSGLVIYANNQSAKSKIKDDNNKDLTARVEILEKEREYAREQHIENQKAIANLEGQLKTYKDIPLQQIATSIEEQAKASKEILNVLRGSAEVAENEAKTGGLLVRNTEKSPLTVKAVKG